MFRFVPFWPPNLRSAGMC